MEYKEDLAVNMKLVPRENQFLKDWMVVEPATELKPRLLICYTNFNRARWYGAVQYNKSYSTVK